MVRRRTTWLPSSPCILSGDAICRGRSSTSGKLPRMRCTGMPIPKRCTISPRDWSCSRPCHTRWPLSSTNSPCASPLARHYSPSKAMAPRKSPTPTPAPTPSVSRWRHTATLPGPVGPVGFSLVRAEHQTARDLGAQLFTQTQHQADAALQAAGHVACGLSLPLSGRVSLRL